MIPELDFPSDVAIGHTPKLLGRVGIQAPSVSHIVMVHRLSSAHMCGHTYNAVNCR